MALFESYERRVDKINSVLAEYGISSIEECKEITLAKGVDCDKIVRETQPICFENAVWAYTVGCAIAIKSGCTKAADAAAAIGIGLQSFCIPGSVADNRKVGLGHGNLGKCSSLRRPSASASSRVTNPSPPQRALSRSLLTQTRSEISLSELSLTALVRTLQ